MFRHLRYSHRRAVCRRAGIVLFEGCSDGRSIVQLDPASTGRVDCFDGTIKALQCRFDARDVFGHYRNVVLGGECFSCFGQFNFLHDVRLNAPLPCCHVAKMLFGHPDKVGKSEAASKRIE